MLNDPWNMKQFKNAKLGSDGILKCAVVRGKGRMDDGINNIYKLFKVGRWIPLQSHVYHSQTSQGATLIFFCNLPVTCHTVRGHDRAPLRSGSGVGVALGATAVSDVHGLTGSCWPLRTQPEHHVLERLTDPPLS